MIIIIITSFTWCPMLRVLCSPSLNDLHCPVVSMNGKTNMEYMITGQDQFKDTLYKLFRVWYVLYQLVNDDLCCLEDSRKVKSHLKPPCLTFSLNFSTMSLKLKSSSPCDDGVLKKRELLAKSPLLEEALSNKERLMVVLIKTGRLI